MNHTAFKKYSPVFWNNLVINKQVLNKHLNFICKNQDFAYQCNPRLIPGWEEEAGFICIRKKFGAWLVYIGLFLWRCKNTPVWGFSQNLSVLFSPSVVSKWCNSARKFEFVFTWELFLERSICSMYVLCSVQQSRAGAGPVWVWFKGVKAGLNIWLHAGSCSLVVYW